jgi:signal transduction histidine kinase
MRVSEPAGREIPETVRESAGFQSHSNDSFKMFLLKLVWIYRILCLLLTMVILLPREGSDDAFPFWFLLYFFAGTFIYPLFGKDARIMLGLNILDYFTALLFQYFEPYSVFWELLWLPGILTAVALIAPSPWAVLLPVLLGIPGCLFLSYSYYDKFTISIAERTYPYYLASLLFYVPVTGLSIMIGRISSYISALRDKAGSLELVNRQLNKINRDISHKMFSLKNDTTLEERKRISKEIHDTAGYVFINLIMMLQAAAAILYRDIGKAERLINETRDYANRGINEIRHILQDIRNYTPESLSLQNEFFDIGKSFQKATDVMVTINYGNWPVTFSKKLDFFFMSFMQEALTNALKHGHATAIDVICWSDLSHVSMSILDNGKGALMPIKKGIGISAMEDFTGQQGGSIIVRSDGQGFKITVTIPLKSVTAI